MLERITDYLVGKISESNYFQKIYPFVEIVNKDNASYPAQYTSKGQYEHVSNFDNYSGMAYFRMTGKQRINRAQSNDMIGMCDTKLEITIPLRLVACVQKSTLTKDDAFTDERISRTLISHLLTDGGPLKDELQATSLKIFPESVTYSNQDILNEEYSGLENMKQINYNFSYHAIDFNVVIEIKESCLSTECTEQYYG